MDIGEEYRKFNAINRTFFYFWLFDYNFKLKFV